MLDIIMDLDMYSYIDDGHFPQRNSVFIVAQEINMMRVFLWATLEISAINKIAKKRSGGGHRTGWNG